MPGNIIRLCFILAIVALVLVIFYLNDASVTVTPWFDTSVEAPLAVVLIFAFGTGILIASVIAGFFALKSSLREKKLKKRLAFEESSRRVFEGIRGQLAAKEHKKAETQLKKILNADPDNTSARILLASSMRERGKLREALRVLDDARQEDALNSESLFMAADLNKKVGNMTAALDNYELLLKQKDDNQEALISAVKLANDLGHYPRAIEYQKQLIRVSPDSRDTLMNELADMELKQIKQDFGSNPDQYLEELNKLLKRHKYHPETLHSLASLEEEKGEVTQATKKWHKAFGLSGNIEYLERGVSLLLSESDAEKTVNFVRSALKEASSGKPANVRGHLYFAALLLHLENIEGAQGEISFVENLPNLSSEESMFLNVLKSELSEKGGKSKEAFGLLKQAVLADKKLPLPTMYLGDNANTKLITRS